MLSLGLVRTDFCISIGMRRSVFVKYLYKNTPRAAMREKLRQAVEILIQASKKRKDDSSWLDEIQIGKISIKQNKKVWPENHTFLVR